MNGTPIRSGSDEQEELARLLPRPAERDLPSDRHRQLQELVMNHIHQDLRPVAQSPRRSPRRLAYLTSALAAGAVAAVAAVAVGAGDDGSTGPAPVPASGQEILLAAATTTENTPEGTGAYWYVKVASTGSRGGESFQAETWTARDGRTWSRSRWQDPAAESASPSAFPERESDGTVIEGPRPNPFSLGGADVTIEELQALPTEPAALKARIVDLVRTSDIRTSAGMPTAAQREQLFVEGLVSLVSLLPAPPRVRAAALRVIASYPNVTDLGAVDGGRGLLVVFHPGGPPARLVIDPTTGQVRRTNILVMTVGGTMHSDGGTFAITAEWTGALPR
jgi:hypothetical protein